MCILRTKNPSGGYVEGSREPAQVRANEGLDEVEEVKMKGKATWLEVYWGAGSARTS